MTAEAESCEGCEFPVAGWSPAFGAWLCNSCRDCRTDAELTETRTANIAARKAAGQ